LYSGGNPNVWLSNNFSNNNVLQFGFRERDFDLTAQTYSGCEPGVPEGPGWCIPTVLFDAADGATSGRNFEINVLDPDFEIPSEWKIALGMTTILPTELVFSADVLWTRGQNTAIVLRGDLEINDERTAAQPDGYPQFDSVRLPSFILTNTDSEDNQSFGLALGLGKTFDNGFDFQVGYAYSDAEDVNPMTSSVAFSNYTNRAFFDPQEEVLSTSNYNIEHRFTATARWRKEVFGDSELMLAFYGAANSGRPYSITQFPIPVFGFTPFLDSDDPTALLPGNLRNEQTGTWWRKIDMRASLDFPGFSDGHRAQAFIVIDNLTNLINDDWGVLEQHNFPRVVEPNTREARIGDASRYEIRFGLQYDF
ncbi:MAG: cell envelope biogenesis protein OmpA, partial [Pseudomonadota bacterium]